MIAKKIPCIICDTREVTPFDFTPYISDGLWTVKVQGLTWGDYSIEGLSDLVVVERKELCDLINCCGTERERFEKEIKALRGFKYKCVMIESDLKTIVKGGWRSKVIPSQVLGTIASWRIRYGCDFVYGGNHELAAGETFRILRKFYEWTQDYAKRFQ
jgi:ERCC4-type nuclease